MAKQPSRHDEPAGFDKGQFKVCDLCGALNHASRPECFVCGWHGHFTTDPDAVHRAGVEQFPAWDADGEAADKKPADDAWMKAGGKPGLAGRIRLLFSRLLNRFR